MNTHSLLPDTRPDFTGGGIINLMASLIRSRGGQANDPESSLLPASELGGFQHLVLLIIDGLGADWLARRSAAGVLSSHRRGIMSSVFPATTASAITSYLTGDAPQQHGLTGWHTWLRELGCVASVLPAKARFGGDSFPRAGINVKALYGLRSLFDRLDCPSVSIIPKSIAQSPFNRALSGKAQVHGYERLEDLFRQIARAVRKARAPSYLYAYWPGLDSLGHDQGIESPQALRHLLQIEQGVEDLMRKLSGTKSLILISGDHGQLDTEPSDEIHLDAHPRLAECLAIPLCGEPRAAFCYLRPDYIGQFEDYCQDRLGEALAMYRSRDLLEAGFFGIGEPHPRLAERIGDYCLLGRGHHVIRDRLRFETPHRQIGVHGGLSRAERLVPLITIAC